MRGALTLCFLWQAFWPRPGGAEHPTADRADCTASGACYSLHHATFKRLEAEEACTLRGGALSPVRGGAELRAILQLLRAGPGPGGGSKDLLFWVALERGRSSCTLDNMPLRGFSWLSPDGDAAGGSDSDRDTMPWVEEPQRSCTARRCAGLLATRGVEPAGWKEARCQLRTDGYLCKYHFEGLCPAPRPGAASNLSYHAPFQLHSAALSFSPPGTQVSAWCPEEPSSIKVTCLQDKGGLHWSGMPPGGLLCACPGRYLRGGKCAQLEDCLDAQGGFACECAEGFQLGKDGHSCVPSAERQPAGGGTKVPTKHPQATQISPVPRRTSSPRHPEKPGELPHGTGQDSSTSSPKIPLWKLHSMAPTLWVSPPTEAKATVSSPGSRSRPPRIEATSSPASPQAFDSSSTVVFVLVSIAVVVLVILTMTVLGLFKLCFHKSSSSRSRKGPLAPAGVESDSEATAARSSDSAHATNNGVN